MIYRIIRFLASITLKAYFRKVIVRGLENIPATGPVIFVANHPSAFMDPMVIGTIGTKRLLHFIAAGEFMGKGLKSWFYRKQLHMIPVYRPGIAETGDAATNEQMFSKCFDLLASGGTVLIFPEGNSVTEKRIRKLKTGAARMALGTRDHNSSGMEVTIVPIGLNYDNPHRFQSDVFVNIGEPVTTKGYASGHDGAVALTDEVERRLIQTVLHVQYEELDSVVKKVELIMKARPGMKREKQDRESDEELKVQQRLVQSIQSVHEVRPEVIEQLEQRLDAYLGKIRQMGIADRSIATLSLTDTLVERLRLFAGRPIFILGFLINAIPYYATLFIFRSLKLFNDDDAQDEKQGVNPAFQGSIAIAIGMVVFILWYLGWATTVGLLTNLWSAGVFALIVFYFTGLFTLRYIGWTLIAGQKSKVRKLLGKGSDLYAELIVERRGIFESIKRMTEGESPNAGPRINADQMRADER